MTFKRMGLVMALLGAAAVAGAPSDVSACGGCFTGPTTVQVVTDHRMVLSISTTQTTLWDQFQYSGAAADFSWILPIRYTDRTQVALADDGFMRLADGITAPVVTPPTRPFCFRNGVPTAGGGFADAAVASDGGVTVLRQEVVGPYAVSIIRGTDPMAVRTWLQSNGYTVPTAVEPIIDHYTAMSMDYVALRLLPGEGINRMTPVRVTLDGAQPLLPLRMIAAGVADRVGVSLVVIAASRYEAQNFPNGEISEMDLTWDFARPSSPASDFLSAFNALNRANGDRLWLTETATNQSRSAWESAAPGYRNTVTTGGAPRPPFDAGAPDVSIGQDVADAGDASATDPLDDVRVAFAGLGDSAVVTRFRSNMLATMLTQDLRLQASDRGLRAINYTYGRLLNDPGLTCGDASVGTDASVGGDASIDGGSTTPVPASTEGGASCSTSPGRIRRGDLTLGALAGLALAAVGLRARRRR